MRRLLVFSAFFSSPIWAQNALSTPPEGMVFVPAGEFRMGTDRRDPSDFNRRDNLPLTFNDARPLHTARTGAFFIDKTEVTNAQYKKFLDATGYLPPPDWKNGQFPEGRENYPVTRVNWYEATAFARWAGKRLPSEIEWEKAARGVDGRLYPWGNNWRPDRAVQGGMRAVGQIPAGVSPYGALDMTGNVMEWTTSWFDAYPNAPTQQPDFGKKFKVLRGGTWFGTMTGGQTFYRLVNAPLARSMYIGFRCVKDADPAPPQSAGS